MSKKSQRGNFDEFPILRGLGLYAAATKADGNCLFRALSDQVYGDDSHHTDIRQQVMKYVKDNAGHFAAFVGEFGENLDQYISRLVQDGVYGGHIEIVGFSDSYKMPVVIYQAENLYIVEPQSSPNTEWKKSAHVAYHTWEHYSSVRRIKGPQRGPADLEVPRQVNIESTVDYESCKHLVPTWKVDIVMRSVPEAPEHIVRKMLLKDDYDSVIERLIMQEFEEEAEEELSSSLVRITSNSAEGFDGRDKRGNNDPLEEASDAIKNHIGASADASSHGGKRVPCKKPCKKLSRKEESKLKRAEKRERVRANKDKSKLSECSEEDQNKKITDTNVRRIIHL